MSTIRSNFIGPLTGTSLPTLSASPVLMDAKAYNWNSLTTNTYLDFDSTVSSTLSGVSGIPSWAKRITVMFNGVSTNGTSNYQIQLGSGSVQTTGYASAGSYSGSSGGGSNSTTGLLVVHGPNAVSLCSGIATIALLSGTTWVSSSVLGRNNEAFTQLGGGVVTLSGALDRVRITTVNGTDTFDAGSVSVMYE